MQQEVVVTWRHQQLAPLLLLQLLLLACVAPWQTRHLCVRAKHRHVRTGVGDLCAVAVAAAAAHCGQASRVRHSCIRCCQAAIVDHRHQQAPESHLLAVFEAEGEEEEERQREGACRASRKDH